MKEIKFVDIEKLLGKRYFLKGLDYRPFNNVKPIFEADEDSVTWINPARKDKKELLAKTKAKIIICDYDLEIDEYKEKKCFLVVENPKAVFTRILRTFFAEKVEYPAGVHSTAIVSPDAKIHESVHIGAFCIIGKCEINEGSIILPYTRIHNDVFIGCNVKINEYCNIGGDGFGHIWDEDNNVEKMPHIGKVIIEDDVEILQFVNIDKGTLNLTHIKQGSVLDHYVHIGHNATVGRNSMVGAKAVFCGGSSIGDNCFIGIQTIIIDAVKIGNNVIIGAGSVVTKPVPDRETWTGSPAIDLKTFIERQGKIKKL